MRQRTISRPNGQIFLIQDDEGTPPTYTYAKENLDVAGRSYWSEIDLAEKPSADTVLRVMRELAFGDATVEAAP